MAPLPSAHSPACCLLLIVIVTQFRRCPPPLTLSTLKILRGRVDTSRQLEERAGVQAPLQVKGLKIEAQVQAWDFLEHIEGGRTQLQIGQSGKTIPFQNIISTRITEVGTGS